MDFQLLTIVEWLTDGPDHFDSQLSERNESISFPSECRESKVHTPRLAAEKSRPRRLWVQGSALGYDTFHS